MTASHPELTRRRLAAVRRVQVMWPAWLLAMSVGIGAGLTVLEAKPLYVVAAAVLLGIGVGAFCQPFVGAVAYVLVQFLRPGEVIPALAAYRPERVLVVLLLVSLTARLVIIQREGVIGRHRLHLAMVGLLLAISASVPTAIWKSGSLAATGNFAKMVVGYFVLVAVVTTRRQFRVVTWAFLLCIGYQALWSYRGFETHQEVTFVQGIDRAIGMTDTFGDPNTIAGLFVAGLPFAFVLALHSGRLALRLIAAAVALLIVVAVPLTGSRGGFIGLAAVLALLPLTSRRRIVTGIGVVVLTIIMWLVTPAQQQQRIRSILTYQNEVTYQTRKTHWRVGREMFRDHPLFGVGIGNFGVAGHELYGSTWHNAHSVYYQVLGETGIVGGAAFAFFIICLFGTQGEIRRRLRAAGDGWRLEYYLAWAMTIAIWSRLITGLAGHNLTSFTYYFVAALTVVLDRVTQTEAVAAGKTVLAAEQVA